MSHSFHLVDESPWPILSAISAFFFTTGLVKWFFTTSPSLVVMSLVMILLSMIQWWKDISSEGAHQGYHSSLVELGLRWGMALFIVSEIFFFVSFFWAFFHSSVAVAVNLGTQWPPMGISALNPWQVPVLNTLVLLSSGASVTWAHHSLIEGDYKNTIQGLGLTFTLGLYFTGLQALEYYEAKFTIADSVYGSTFFIATGFHGLHVVVGSIFLVVSFFRFRSGQMNFYHHFGFEAAAWYWHFVDVVWLFLFVTIYWWGEVSG